MKKLLAISVAAVMLLALSITSFAEAYRPNGEDSCDIVFTLKKADSANVKKDGAIGDGEYERLVVDTTLDNSPLQIAYGSTERYIDAENMLPTMEYYFSWDELHGFNFAVKFKPETIRQELRPAVNSEFPMDNFASQTAINFVGYSDVFREDSDMSSCLFYAIAKSTVDGAYMEGHWGQLGPTGVYDPVEGEDYCISYDFDNGIVTAEWSVPFKNIGVPGTVGSNVYFSIACTSGVEAEKDYAEDDFTIYEIAYGVNIGDYAFLGPRNDDNRFATATVSDELIVALNDGDDDQDNGDQGNGDQGNNDQGNGDQGNGDQGNGDQGNGDQGNNDQGSGDQNSTNAPQTADLAVFAAVVSAVSDAGLAISKKRR